MRTVNEGAVRILTEGFDSRGSHVVADMGRILNDPGHLRVLPVIGEGTVQSIADLMYLNAIDLGIMQADVLAYVRRAGIHPGIDRGVRYVTRLGDKQVHVLASYGSKTIQDLDGKLVSYGVQGSGSFVTADTLFQALGIEALPVYHDHETSIEKIRRGEIAAAVLVTERAAPWIATIEPSDGLRLLPAPISDDLDGIYEASTLSHEDYPTMIASGQWIQTIAVPEVLAVYNWTPGSDRYAEVKSFVDKFLVQFEAFRQPLRLPVWQEVDLATDLPGWRRFRPVDDWFAARELPFDERQVYERESALSGEEPPPSQASDPNDDDLVDPHEEIRDSLQERWESDP